MGEGDAVPLRHKRCDGGGRARGVLCLCHTAERLAPAQQRIATEGGDDMHQPSVATRIALMECMRFSAWSNTIEAGDSKTCSVTSMAEIP